MMEDKLNTAEHDHKGRCVRHPDVRLRKKKLLGGWKILIGHCPECCLDEMRRVRDEIEGGEKKKKKKHHKDKKKEKKHNGGRGSDDTSHEVSLSSEGYDPNSSGEVQGSRQYGNGRRHREDGESQDTGSTAQMSGGGSVVSEQYYRNDAHLTSTGNDRWHGGDYARGHHRQRHPPPSPPGERTMVLSMAFIDPQTGQRGTYTGQVNSLHKPDGKGTVYYNNGTIAEGSWNNGILVEEEEEHQQQQYSRSPPNRGGHPRHQPPPPRRDQESGNLHLLSALPGKSSRSRGGSASVQSYNSRNSHDISGSASVQAYSMSAYGSGGGGGYRSSSQQRVSGGGGQYGGRRYGRGEYDP